MTANRDWHSVPLAELGLSARAVLVAESVGATTVGRLCDLSEDEAVYRRVFGDTLLQEIRARLAEHGLRLWAPEKPGEPRPHSQEPPRQHLGLDPRLLDMSLAELQLSVRATNCLESEGITTVRDLVIRDDDELLEVRNFGETTLREVKEKLARHGLQLGMKLTG
jgi:DNA-directed RNA polymerase alpha subunit